MVSAAIHDADIEPGSIEELCAVVRRADAASTGGPRRAGIRQAPEASLLTDAREERWCLTGDKSSPVTVCTPAPFGAFPDEAETLRDLRHVSATLTHGDGGDLHRIKARSGTPRSR